MANNRVAYGLAKEYGIDTTGKSPKEVWEALKGKGINQDNFQQYQNRQNESYDKLSHKGAPDPTKEMTTAISQNKEAKQAVNEMLNSGVDYNEAVYWAYDEYIKGKQPTESTNTKVSQKPKTKASETYRLSYSGEEIPKKDVEFAVVKTINNGRWNINDVGGLDMAIKDAAGTLLDTYENMSYEEAYDYASDIAEKYVEDKKNKPEPKATKKMIDSILADKEAEKAANKMLKSGNLSFNEVAVLVYNYYIKGKKKG